MPACTRALMEIIYEWIYRVNDEGKAIILISHDMDTIFTLSKRLLVLNYGDLIADGDPGCGQERSAGQSRLPGRR